VQLRRPGVAVDPGHDALHAIERGAVQQIFGGRRGLKSST
jgi:hypothetical protein